MQNTVKATIDLSAIRSNLEVVRRLCPRSRIMAMVKANAYGHGLIPTATALQGADGLGVARLHEALLLREAGIRQRILVLATLLDASDLETCSKLSIDVVAHDKVSVECIASQARYTPLRVWLKLDSGMHRAGLSTEAFVTSDLVLSRHSGVVELIHMTHFSSADEPDGKAIADQLSCFSRAHMMVPKASVSLANSAALILNPSTHADWVRPGIMLYGENPASASKSIGLRSAMTVTAYVIAVREIGTGESVGYNAGWTAMRRSRIGTIGIGYGDGYPRHARNGTPVLVNGRLAPLVGRVSMDSLTVDLTDCPDVRVGDHATLWGTELPVSTIAQNADTISNDVLTSLQARVEHEYV